MKYPRGTPRQRSRVTYQWPRHAVISRIVSVRVLPSTMNVTREPRTVQRGFFQARRRGVCCCIEAPTSKETNSAASNWARRRDSLCTALPNGVATCLSHSCPASEASRVAIQPSRGKRRSEASRGSSAAMASRRWRARFASSSFSDGGVASSGGCKATAVVFGAASSAEPGGIELSDRVCRHAPAPIASHVAKAMRQLAPLTFIKPAWEA